MVREQEAHAGDTRRSETVGQVGESGTGTCQVLLRQLTEDALVGQGGVVVHQVLNGGGEAGGGVAMDTVAGGAEQGGQQPPVGGAQQGAVVVGSGAAQLSRRA